MRRVLVGAAAIVGLGLVVAVGAPAQSTAETLRFLGAWGGSGSGPGRFEDASSIAVAPSGDVSVADAGTSTIHQFTANGRFVRMWGGVGSALGQFGRGSPRGIAVAPDGLVYATDRTRVQVFSADGKVVGAFGGEDVVDAYGIAADSGTVYVTDATQRRVKLFTRADGDLYNEWGALGFRPGEFQAPLDVAVDIGIIYVVDRLNDRVSMFDSGGRPVGELRGMRDPRGVDVNGEGSAYVAAFGDQAVHRFGVDETRQATYRSGIAGRSFIPVDVALGAGGIYVLTAADEVLRFREIPAPTATAATGAPTAGVVLVRRPGERAASPMSGEDVLPRGTAVDVRNGRLDLVVLAEGESTATGTLWGGRFVIGATTTLRTPQAVGAVIRVTRLALAPALACRPRRPAVAGAVRQRGLNARIPRHFRVVGRYASVRPLGSGIANISVSDTCASTRIVVKSGRVEVFDLVRKRGRAVSATRTVTVKPRPRRRA